MFQYQLNYYYRLTKCIRAAAHWHKLIARNSILRNSKFVISILSKQALSVPGKQIICYVLQWPQYVHQTHIFRDYSLRWAMRSICIHLIYCLAIFFCLRRHRTLLDPLSVERHMEVQYAKYHWKIW